LILPFSLSYFLHRFSLSHLLLLLSNFPNRWFFRRAIRQQRPAEDE